MDTISTDQNPVRSLERVLDVLDLFRGDQHKWTMSDIADKLGWPAPTAHRTIGALAAREYLVRDEGTKRYRLGPAVLSLIAPLLAEADPARLAQPHLDQLAEDVGETVSLAMIDGAYTLYLATTLGPSLLRVDSHVGLRLPAHCTALGKCLLATMDRAAARRSVGEGPYEQLTADSAVGWADLEPMLDEIERRGHALSIGEFDPDLISCAVPVWIPGAPITALNVAAPRSRLTVDDVERVVVPKLQSTAAAIGRSAGGMP